LSTTVADSKLWDHYYAEEADAAYLYRALATSEPDPKRRDLFARLAEVEDRHVEHWGRLLEGEGRKPSPPRPSIKAKALAWLARRFGSTAILPLILAEEGREVATYLRLSRDATNPGLRESAATIAVETADHARELGALLGRPAEPWHTTSAGGYLRSVVYGFNDGLTANFGLVAGVIGASVSPHIVIITGVAGAVADALSMGSSGYLAAKSEAEVHEHEVEMERQEIALMPELEEEELALIYEAKGLKPDLARSTARVIMSDPVQALETKVREELQISDSRVTPLRDGLITGTATAVGAVIPILPFLIMPANYAIWVSLTISMLAHFGVGAARSIFTGRGVWASGRDMFLVGFGVAAAGYVIGLLFKGSPAP
jgi:VIT1/CCC1 family predicted Fe2+/Mn2+ transporter/rubrerythrin